MTITQYRDACHKAMRPEVFAAGAYLEHQGLLFGYDFVAADAIELAAAFMTRKYDEDERDRQLEAFSKMYDPKPNRFQEEERFA